MPDMTVPEYQKLVEENQCSSYIDDPERLYLAGYFYGYRANPIYRPDTLTLQSEEWKMGWYDGQGDYKERHGKP